MLFNKLLMEGNTGISLRGWQKTHIKHTHTHKHNLLLAQSRTLIMFQLVLTTIYLLREQFCSVGNLMKVFGELFCTNQPAVSVFFWRGEEQEQGFNVIHCRTCMHRETHTHAHTYFWSKQRKGGYLNGD